MLRFFIALVPLSLVVLVGCGGPPPADQEPPPAAPGPPPIEAASQLDPPTTTVEVTAAAEPDYTWSLVRVLDAYLTAASASERASLVVDSSPEAMALATLEPLYDADEVQIHPPLKTELYPNESLDVRVDLPDAPSTIFVVTRTDDGYRVNLRLTASRRHQAQLQRFIETHGLDKTPCLTVQLMTIERQQQTAQLRLIVGNESPAPVNQFELILEANHQDGETLLEHTLAGGPLAPGKTTDIKLTITDLPEAATACSFRIQRVLLDVPEEEFRDATKYYAVRQVTGG